MCNVALSSVEADVYIWRYALLVVHARKEDVYNNNNNNDRLTAFDPGQPG